MRLVTRSDFDGLACAALLKELGIIEDCFYTHPKDLQDGNVQITKDDVLANVPFVEGCGLWFDHHSSEHERLELKGKFIGSSEQEPSTARVIYNYYINDPQYKAKLNRFDEMIAAVDKADSAQFTEDDILAPKRWVLLAFISDPRTSLGYHKTYTTSNFDLMKTLPDLLRTKTVDEILAMSDFQERIKMYLQESETYKSFLLEASKVQGDAIVLDFRGLENLPSGNRFMEYTLFPKQNISVRLVDVKRLDKVMFSIGHSIINRSSSIDVGSLVLKYGGGGHKKVGTCQVPLSESDKVLTEVLEKING